MPQKKSKQQQKKKEQLRLLLFKSLLVIVTTAIIVYFIPRFSSFSYNYELNQPWRYGTLISSQKFNIMMSDSAQIHKRDSITSQFIPYYNKDKELCRNVKMAFRSLADKNMLDARYIWTMTVLLDSVYHHGIISTSQYDSIVALGITQIRIIANHTANVVPLSQVFTAKKAYQYIIDRIPQRYMSDEKNLSVNINDILANDLTFDYQKSTTALNEELNGLSFSMGFVSANERIVDRGEIITPEIYQKLKSYEYVVTDSNKQNQGSQMLLVLLGQIVFVLIILSLLVSYLAVYRKDYLAKHHSAILLFLLITVFCMITSIMVSHHILHVFIIPLCMVPIIIRIFYDSRTAFVFHCGMLLLISISLSQPYDFILIETIAGFAAVMNLRELTQRSQIIRVSLVVTITSIAFYCTYMLATGTELHDIEYRTLLYFLINGVLLLFTYPLLWMMEKLFGFVSDVTLVELSNINHPLLRQLSEDAPGTFQHSMQVANLAAEVAKKISAKVLLVRTGALYHDIGKMDRPVFFTENQAGGNPHKHMSATKSAEVIIAHVSKGLALAEKYDLPETLRNFISSHHGTGKTQYFLVTYKNEHPDEEIDESLFTYPGPNPSTKEEAILMMSDAVEAASRSLNEYTEENISDLVDKIIDNQVDSGFFTECPITFRDISETKEVFKNRLKTIYHTRISYPELNQSGTQA